MRQFYHFSDPRRETLVSSKAVTIFKAKALSSNFLQEILFLSMTFLKFQERDARNGKISNNLIFEILAITIY